jgi:hypothetical protein
MFAGFVGLGDALVGAFLVKNAQESPDSLPTFKAYGPGGLMQHGTAISTPTVSRRSGGRGMSLISLHVLVMGLQAVWHRIATLASRYDRSSHDKNPLTTPLRWQPGAPRSRR